MLHEPTSFIFITATLAVLMLIWNTIEVGRNDAANIVNAVFGSRVMRRKQAVWLSGFAVVIGALASSAVMETARKGIFDPTALSEYGPLSQIEDQRELEEAQRLAMHNAISVYISVYLTNTVLLYSFSAFGMPVSTTACLVFSLLGAGMALGGPVAIHWDKSRQVIAEIIFSILFSGVAGFWVQRAFRGAIGADCRNETKVGLHGPWIAGALFTGLLFFILMKGMKNVGFVESLRMMTVDELGYPIVLTLLWVGLSCIIASVLWMTGDRLKKHLFSGLAILGMLAIAFAFGQNDLANCASPGIASWMILTNAEIHTEVSVPRYLLLGCGILLFMGMMTKSAQRVTRAEVNTGSQGDVVRLYAPEWCIRLAKFFAPRQELKEEALAPKPKLEPDKKLQHYDALRAAVITSVSASVIAFASGRGLPVSTTYVSFAAVIATGWADRVFARGDSHLKLGRTIWVVTGWFLSAFIAAVCAGLCAKVVSLAGTLGVLIALSLNLIVRAVMKNRADSQEERLQLEAAERKKQLLGDKASQTTFFATDFDAE